VQFVERSDDWLHEFRVGVLTRLPIGPVVGLARLIVYDADGHVRSVGGTNSSVGRAWSTGQRCRHG